MSYTIQQAKDDLAGIVHGKTVNKITNIFSAATRAGRNLLAMVDPDETRQIAQLTLYDRVTDVAAPADLKEKRIIDIRPQFSTTRDRSTADNLSNRMSKDFDMRRRWGSWFTVMDVNGLKYLRVKASLTPSALGLDTLDTINGWTADGTGAQNLALESIVYDQGAFQFDMAAGQSTGYIQSTTIASVDLTTAVNKSAGFLELYIPTAAALAAIVSIDLRWGNDTTTKYYNRTITTAHLGALRVGKNTLRFDWNGATKTGAVDPATIDSARITINTNGSAISALIVSNLFFSIARIWEIEYYSKNLFQDKNGVWKSDTDDDEDVINLDVASYNIFLLEFALAGLQQIQGKDAAADRSFVEDQLYGNSAKNIIGAYPLYKENNPSQKEKVTQSYYNNFGFRGADGGRYRRW